MEPIVVSNLTQIYQSGKGIFDVSFSVKRGEIFGYLGPNGAGKTTTIRNLMGFTNAKSGSAAILGKDCRAESAALKAHIGYLPGEMALYDRLTGIAFLNFIGQMRRMQDTSFRDALIKRFDLEINQRIRRMSKGMKQKLGILTAFMHHPDIYILDEPTSGLDPIVQNECLSLILEEKAKGKTILMSSHIFDEVEKVCDRVAIIKEGRLVYNGNISEIKKDRHHVFIAIFKSEADIKKLASSGLSYTLIHDKTVEITVKQDFDTMFKSLSKCDVVSFKSKPQTLEDFFLTYFKKGDQ